MAIENIDKNQEQLWLKKYTAAKLNDTQASMLKSQKTNQSGGVNSNGNGADAVNQSSDFSSIHTFFEAK